MRHLGMKLLTHPLLSFSYLNDFKLRHGLRHAVDPMCNCGPEIETTLRFLLRCRLYSTIRAEILPDIYTVVSSVTSYSDEKLSLVWIRVYQC